MEPVSMPITIMNKKVTLNTTTGRPEIQTTSTVVTTR